MTSDALSPITRADPATVGHHYPRHVRDRNAHADVPRDQLERPALAPVDCWAEVVRARERRGP